MKSSPSLLFAASIVLTACSLILSSCVLYCNTQATDLTAAMLASKRLCTTAEIEKHQAQETGMKEAHHLQN